MKNKIMDAISSVLPIMIIMLFISILLRFNLPTVLSILISTILLIMGMSLFMYGAELSMIEIGKAISSSLLKSKKPLLIIGITLIVGMIITIAEPDLKVLAEQMTAINSTSFILSVGLGVGLFLALATVRIMYQLNLKIIIVLFYGIILFLLFFVTKDMIPIAFDSGGVTTGPISVPFIIAMGIGFSASRARNKSKNDSFGLVAMCSIGPILIVLLFSLFTKNDLNYQYNISQELSSLSSLFASYGKRIIPTLKEVILSILPILGVFILYNALTKKIKKKKCERIIIGLITTFVGLSLFFVGVYAGYMQIAYLIGIKMLENYHYLLIPLGIIVGLVIVKAEPAVAILSSQIEKITQGNVSKKVINNTISIGVALAAAISIIRVLTGISLVWFLVIGYLIALILMLFTSEEFTMIAFDSGGAVTGPMTTSFLLPLIIGICFQKGGNVMTDAFGLVALVALSPLITIQLLGLLYNIKAKYVPNPNEIDESIIEYDWGYIS